MRFIYDHDFHIHSQISDCSRDPAQTSERILEYAKINNLNKIALTNHYWDDRIPGASDWYQKQNTAWIERARPLPQAEGISFVFGAETDMDANGVIGIDCKTMENLDFAIVSISHFHMAGFTCRGDENAYERGRLWLSRFEYLLRSGLPFERVGLGHMTYAMIDYENMEQCAMRTVSDSEMIPLFRSAAASGLGIELNFAAFYNGVAITWETHEALLHPYRLAKECGCKFYIGSDAHHPDKLEAEKQNAEKIIDLLQLTEDDKFAFAKA